jgi:hypothetical protein
MYIFYLNAFLITIKKKNSENNLIYSLHKKNKTKCGKKTSKDFCNQVSHSPCN